MIQILNPNTDMQIRKYPDATPFITINTHGHTFDTLAIEWKYDSMDELPTLYSVTEYLKENNVCQNLTLNLPYMPGARMDRTQDSKDVRQLKYIAQMINQMNFIKIYVLDPHSSVTENVLKNVHIIFPRKQISEVLSNFQKAPLLFYPDEGSLKRYSPLQKTILQLPYCYGAKKRDWKSGDIQGLEVYGATERIKGKDILIIDDICSKGGTFLHSTRKLKSLGANDIYLYVTHCENTILEGELINSGLIKHIYTTNSIFRCEHPLITVINI